MIAARFRFVGWVAGCAGAALCCYMASQSVAAERSALGRVDSEIAGTRDDITQLQTEIAARSRMGQLERWNGTLALQAARPAQYVASDVQLASLAGDRALPLDPAIVASHGAVDKVSYQPAAQPAPASALPAAPIQPPVVHDQPLLRTATYVRPKPDRLADDQPQPIVKAAFVKASLVKDVADTPKIAKAAHAKAEVGLLPTDLGSLIAAERKGTGKRAPTTGKQ